MSDKYNIESETVDEDDIWYCGICSGEDIEE